MPSYNWPQLKPMLATHSEPFDHEDYLFEIKWDGFRCLAYLNSEKTILYSRNGVVLNKRFPQLSELHRYTPASILDGEIVALEKGVPNFSALQASFEKRKPLPANCQLSFVVFDLLYLEDQSLLSKPLWQRKSQLASSLENHGPLLVSQYIEGDGISLFKQAQAHQLEGIMAKHKQSRYLPGQRSELWKKIKWRQTEVFWVCGFIYEDKRLVSLAVANRSSDDEPLVYRGQVGSGFKQRQRTEMLPLLRQLEVESSQVLNFPKQASLVPIQPIVQCKVEYLEYTSYGLIRQPVLTGFVTPE